MNKVGSTLPQSEGNDGFVKSVDKETKLQRRFEFQVHWNSSQDVHREFDCP